MKYKEKQLVIRLLRDDIELSKKRVESSEEAVKRFEGKDYYARFLKAAKNRLAIAESALNSLMNDTKQIK